MQIPPGSRGSRVGMTRGMGSWNLTLTAKGAGRVGHPQMTKPSTQRTQRTSAEKRRENLEPPPVFRKTCSVRKELNKTVIPEET